MQVQHANDTDLNWVKLISIFYQKKIWIVLSTLLGLLIGLAFIIYSKPVYEAQIKLIAATEADIIGFNQGISLSDPLIKPITTAQVYFAFTNELLSDSVKKDFFAKYYLPTLKESQKKNQTEASLYTSFSKAFVLVAYTKTASEQFGKYLVVFRGHNSKQVTLWLNQFITMVRERTYNNLLGTLKKNYAVAVKIKEAQIESVRKLAKEQRMDRLIQLREQMSMLQLAKDKASESSNGISAKLALIQAEISSLSERDSDDAYIPDLRQLQEQLAHYKLWTVNSKEITLFRPDGTIETPSYPIEPKKQLIIMLSLVLGFMVSILGIMVHIAWRRERVV